MSIRLLSRSQIYADCFLAAFSLCFALVNPAWAQTGQKCLPVHGLSFEKVSHDQLLATRDGENVAFITTGRLPNKLGTFRFFSSVLCTKGVEGRFHIDGQLIYVLDIERFPTLK